MVNKMTHAHSLQIVQRAALRTIRTHRLLLPETRLGEILVTRQESELFRTHVHAEVKAEGFEIELGRIPTEPHVTIDHVASIVLMLSGLAGNSGTDDPS